MARRASPGHVVGPPGRGPVQGDGRPSHGGPCQNGTPPPPPPVEAPSNLDHARFATLTLTAGCRFGLLVVAFAAISAALSTS